MSVVALLEFLTLRVINMEGHEMKTEVGLMNNES